MKQGHCIGHTPKGNAVYVSEYALAVFGRDRLRYELVDREWLREGIDPPGYYRVRTHPFRSDYVLIRAESREQAIEKFLAAREGT